MRGFAKNILPELQAMYMRMPSHGSTTRLGNDLRKLINLVVMYSNGLPARGDPVRDVEFRYSTYSARVDSEMEEERPQWPF